jgi:hypothetical protein
MDDFEDVYEAYSWQGFQSWVDKVRFGGTWCFRGERDASWELNTSLDRALPRRISTPEREALSAQLLFRFQQQAHQYISLPPAHTDLSSWLAIMQHHGAPTRLLDWTKSPYAALYFAFEEEPPENGLCAVRAIDLNWLEHKARERLQTDAWMFDDWNARAELMNALLRSPIHENLILRVDPIRLDDRMVAQQGLFLCNVTLGASFGMTLQRMIKDSDLPPHQYVLKRAVVKRELRADFLQRLSAMNVHRASLFPGLDGFGRFLKYELETTVNVKASFTRNLSP